MLSFFNCSSETNIQLNLQNRKCFSNSNSYIYSFQTDYNSIMIRPLLHFIVNLFKSRIQLQLEKLFLRKQLEIISRSNKRVGVKRRDRVFFSLTKGLLNNWKDNLVIVKPETVI